ncbi:LexA family transcriptional regulator [Pseudomonas sp.]|uniref:LexA family transcriptional regulator n=1 Tax=Pseudomonas sp. TaxID=306 RepID=UPI003263B29D
MTKDSRRLPLADWQLEDSDRLKEIFQQKRSQLKLTQEKIAAELGEGVTQGAVSHFMNRRTALSLKAAAVFARMLEVPVADFSPRLAEQLKSMTAQLPPTDYGRPSSNDAKPPSDQTDSSPLPMEGEIGNDRYAFIPQYSAKAAAGFGHENPHVESVATLAFKREWLRIKGVNPKNLIVIYADGESMWPTINDHDVLLIDKSRAEPANGQIFVMASADKGAIVKRLVQSPLGGWIIRSDNEDKDEHPDLLLSRSEINEHRIIGRVIWRGGDL